ncbi:MAG: hypothetical protein Q9169_008389, partial [Polycauliona sp. 2 TL-2023]
MPPPPSKPSAPQQSPWVETETGNKVSRRAQLHGTQHITLGGRCVISPNVCIRGDLVRPAPSSSTSTSTDPNNPKSQATAAKKPHPITSVTLGKYVILCPGVLLKPALRMVGGRNGAQAQHIPLTIGSHVFIAASCTISAASIGDHVVLEPSCVI